MSNTSYIEYRFRISPRQPGSDILIAELGEAGFESFVEEDEGILAYIQKTDWFDGLLKDIEILKNDQFQISYQQKLIEQENWNATWEQNFDPILVGHRCVVRAPFHEQPDVEFDIIIEPKMSFGTGHHETTYMMLVHILDFDCMQKSVLDMGSGTGVLAILAAMKGAAKIDAIDIDHWCYLNAIENIDRNDCGHVRVFEGDASLLTDQKYDVIIANINRNILLEDIPAYARHLNDKGTLFLSGFYEEDVALMSSKCASVGLKFEKKFEKNNWVAVKYVF